VPVNAEMATRIEASLARAPAKPAKPKTPAPAILAPPPPASQAPELISAKRPTGGGVLPGKLSAAKIAKLIGEAKAGRLSNGHRAPDGHNLYLQISNRGAGASWLFRYNGLRFGRGRDVPLGLGGYPTVDIDMAREQARQYRLMLKDGKDPKSERDNQRLDRKIALGQAKTAGQVADEYFATHVARKSASHQAQAKRWLEQYVHEPIGDMPVEKVTQTVILDKCGLRELWISHNPSARGVQSHLSRLFDLAIHRDYYTGKKNPAAWSTLKHVLPTPRDVHRRTQHASVPYKDAGRFAQSLRSYRDGRVGGQAPFPNARTTVSLAVEMLLLTGVRTNEVRAAQWKEIDFPAKDVWLVPWQHLKTGYLHGKSRAVPITEPMRAIFDEMQKRRFDQSPEAPVFPGDWSRDGRLNRDTFSTFIRNSLGWEEGVTNHGFRTTLKDWCLAKGFSLVWWAVQVNHETGSKSDRSYGEDDLLEERRGMMEHWGRYLSAPAPETGGAVVEFKPKRRRTA
jgi:integrase